MKSLKNVQLIAKILLILTIIGFCCTLVGAAGALMGGGVLLAVPLLGEELADLILSESGAADFPTLGISLIAEAVFLAGIAVSLFYTMRYLRAEEKDGTPFTHAGADLLLRTGIINLAVPFAAVFAASLITAIAGVDNALSNSFEIVSGVTMILLSFVFRYGADIAEGHSSAE